MEYKDKFVCHLFGIDDLIMGGMSLAGGLFAQSKTDDRLQAQMDFQREMANTAWQRGMKDMKKAGLNPILAYQKGPASSPTGAFAAAEDIVTPGVNTAMAHSKNTADVANALTTNNLIKAQTDQTVTNADLNRASTMYTNARTANEKLESAIKLNDIDRGASEAAKRRGDTEQYEDPGVGGQITRGSRYLGNIIKEIFPFFDAGNSAASTAQKGHVIVRPRY